MILLFSEKSSRWTDSFFILPTTLLLTDVYYFLLLLSSPTGSYALKDSLCKDTTISFRISSKTRLMYNSAQWEHCSSQIEQQEKKKKLSARLSIVPWKKVILPTLSPFQTISFLSLTFFTDHFCNKIYGKQEKKETLKVFYFNFCRLKSKHTRKGGSAALEPSRESPGWSFL